MDWFDFERLSRKSPEMRLFYLLDWLLNPEKNDYTGQT
jgi:hypothetical protein